MHPNDGGSYSERLLRHLILFPPTSRSTSAVHRTPQKQSKKPARNSGLLSEGQHTFRIDASRPTHGWRWAAAPSNPASEKRN